MKKITSLVFSVFFTLTLFAQANGGWGICEFSTTAAMNAFDPSSSNMFCKRVFVQATNKHYYWNGSTWIWDEGGLNIYSSSDTLTSDRIVEGDSNDLTFTGIVNYLTSAATSTFRSTLNMLYEADKDGNGSGEHQFYTGSTEQLTIENGGTLDLLQYGDGTYEDNVNNTFDLGVDSSGNVIEVDRRVSKIDTTAFYYSVDTNNMVLSGLTTAPYYEVYRIHPTADIEITGIDATGVKDGQRVTLLNVGDDKWFKLKEREILSTASNRIIMPNNADETIRKGGSVTLIYDATSARWRVYAIAP